MNLPDELPNVVARGPVGRAMAMFADRFNGLLRCVQSLQPMMTANSRTTHSPIGVSHEPIAKGTGDETTTGGAARWA